MSVFRRLQIISLLTSIVTVSAQNNSTNGTDSTCPSASSYYANATWAIPFQILTTPGLTSPSDDQDWVFRYNIHQNATLDTDDPPSLFQSAFISVPNEKPEGYENRTLRACVFQGPQLNVSSVNQADWTQSCNNILSQNCTDTIARWATRPTSEDSECRLGSQARDKIQEACGWVPGRYNTYGTSLTDSTSCPARPTDYVNPSDTQTTLVTSLGVRDPAFTPDQQYDLALRQVVPWIIGAAWDFDNGQSAAGDQNGGVLCIAPTSLSPGSRQSAIERFPDAGSGAMASLDVRRGWVGAALVAGVVGFALL